MTEGGKSKQDIGEDLYQTRDCQYKKTAKTHRSEKDPRNESHVACKRAQWQQPANWEGAAAANKWP